MARRRKTPAPPKPKAPRNQWQRRRDDALSAKGYTKVDVWRQIQSDGGDYSEAAVRAVLDGRYRNVEIAEAFCTLTGMSLGVAFPLDEAPHRAQPASRRNMTMARRAQMQQQEARRDLAADEGGSDARRS